MKKTAKELIKNLKKVCSDEVLAYIDEKVIKNAGLNDKDVISILSSVNEQILASGKTELAFDIEEGLTKLNEIRVENNLSKFSWS
jgi:Trk K+ transport system NAD-binding subunit